MPEDETSPTPDPSSQPAGDSPRADDALLLLDVDGVLSPDRPEDADPAWGPFVDRRPLVRDTNYSLPLSDTMLAAVGGLPVAERRWLSTWGELANEHVGAHAGWAAAAAPAWQRLSGGHEQKLYALIKQARDWEGGRVIWADDELLGPYGVIARQIEAVMGDEERLIGQDLLLLPTQAKRGLTAADVAHAGAWLAGGPDPWAVVVRTGFAGPVAVDGVHPSWEQARLAARELMRTRRKAGGGYPHAFAVPERMSGAVLDGMRGKSSPFG